MNLLRKPLAAIFGLSLLLALGSLSPTGSAQQPAPGPRPDPAPARPFPTGARSSRTHWLAYQAAGGRFAHAAKAAPASFTPAVILSTSQMSYWGNDQYGDCVSAEEAFAKDIYPVWYSTAGQPVLIPTATVTQWARQHGYLNGADLTSVMDDMARFGMSQNGVTYTDGPYASVDYTNWTTLTSAIYQGPVKIGVAAGQLQNTAGVGQRNGWVATGYRRDGNEDHCVSLCGYGTMSQLASAMGVALPSGVNGSANGLLLFTWDSIGIIDFASMNAITAEAWLRSPTTPQTIPPQPNPPPAPTGLTWALTGTVPSGATLDQSGNFSWAIPTSQPAGPVTITFTVTNSAGSAAGSFVVTATASATGAPVIATIPPQTATIGSTFTVGLGQYVSTAAPKTPDPAPAPMPPLPSPNPGTVTPSPQSGTEPMRKAA